MADPILFKTHTALGLSRLLHQFQGQPNFQGILRSFLTQIQEVEDMLFSLMVDRYLDTAVGAQLDGIGRIVDQLRSGQGDIDYQVSLKGRIISNRANSRVEDLYFLFTLLLPGFTFELTDNPAGSPAALLFEINEALTVGGPAPGVLNTQLQIAKGAGIRANLLYGSSPQADAFSYASGDVLEPDAQRGYSNDAGTSGGHYRDIFG